MGMRSELIERIMFASHDLIPTVGLHVSQFEFRTDSFESRHVDSTVVVNLKGKAVNELREGR